MRKIVIIGVMCALTFTANSQELSNATEIENAGIVGGDLAEGEEYPWMCSIILDAPTPGCGASLIAPQWVLTAAHCELSSFDITSTHVLINSLTLDLDDLQPYAELIEIEEFIVHEDFNSFSVEGPDIALIRLSEPSGITPVEIATLDESDYYEHGDPARALGWGLTEEGMASDELLKVDCRFFSSDTCAELYSESPESFYDLNAGGNICAGYFSGEAPAGAAQGDSGGPLFFIDDEGNYKQVGVVSGGEYSITTEEFPGVFTWVAQYKEWIENTIEDYEIALSLAAENRENLKVTYFANTKVAINGLAPESTYEIAVYDLMGNLVQTGATNVGNTAFEVEVTDFTTGMYLMHVVNRSNGNLTVEKFVVN